MSRLTLILAVLLVVAIAAAIPAAAQEAVFGPELVKKYDELVKSGLISPETQTCIGCHIQVTPDVVWEWVNSAHAHNKPAALEELYKAIGQEQWIEKINWPPAWWNKEHGKSYTWKNYPYVVGCYECHGMFHDNDRPDIIPNHNGYKIVTIVTRKDCGQCHPKEDTEISWTWHATGTLHATFLPWYRDILKWAKEHGANPFGDEQAKKLYEEYFPPYLLYKRDTVPIYWNFYKKIAKAIYDYLNNKMTEEDQKIINMLKEATGMITPYDMDFKNWLTPLWPSQPPANTTLLEKLGIYLDVKAMGEKEAKVPNVMAHPWYRNGYIYHACIECHGSIVIPYKLTTTKDPKTGMQAQVMLLWGWPSNGAARVDPDGSIGTCTACHPRHLFSVKQARKPWTCGQCHLGYDHPHIEIYEESKHGNIENAYGEKWNWEHLPWVVGIDFNAPTCATCHMSTLAVEQGGQIKIVVPGTHDLVARLVWDQMHFFSHPKPVIPDKPQVAMFLGGFSVLKGDMDGVKAAMEKIPENSLYKSPVFMGFKIIDNCKPGQVCFPRLLTIEYTGELAKHREEMVKVCTLCHSSQWVENFFHTADQNIIDYDIVAHFAFNLLKLAWKLGIQDPTNPLDEIMELEWYYIWHHQGRRWRNGAFMQGPDYAHWFGVVDTIMEALNRMVNYFYVRMLIRKLQTELQALKQQAAGAKYTPALAAKIAELEQKIAELKAKLAALEALVPELKQKIESVEGGFEQLNMKVNLQNVNVQKLMKEVETLAKELEGISPKAKQIAEVVAKLDQLIREMKSLKSEVSSVKSLAQKASAQASSAYSLAEEVKSSVESLKSSLESTAAATNTVAAVGIILAVIAIIIAALRRR